MFTNNDEVPPPPSFRDSISSSGKSIDDEEEEVIKGEVVETLSTRIKLRLSAKSLPLVGKLSRRPDCWCVVTLLGKCVRNRTESVLGQTEVITKTSAPQWTETLILNYDYGTKLYFIVKVLRKSNQHGQKTVGSALFEVSDLLACNKTKVKRFPSGGILVARLRVLGAMEDKSALFRFQLRTMELSLPNMRSDFDMMLELCRLRVRKFGDCWVVVYRSGPIMDATLPLFEVAEISLDSGISDEELQWPIRFMVWDKQRRTLLGSVETTLHSVFDSLITVEFDEPSERDLRLLRKGKEKGKLRVVKAELITSAQDSEEFDAMSQRKIEPDSPTSPSLAAVPPNIATFHNYMTKGYDLNLCVAVDVTSSNGDPRSEDSIHFILDTESNNDYQEVIQEVGAIFAQYSKTKEHSMWGFGAKFNGQVRHIFQCGPTQTVKGVQGLQEAYRSIFQRGMVMSGPTVYDSVIQAAAMKAKTHDEDKNTYCVLVIITDGGSIDMEETKRKISLYSELPLSIVFVGVGRADFKQMRELTSLSCRRTVSFVELRNHQQDLAGAALQPVADQIVEYRTQH